MHKPKLIFRSDYLWENNACKFICSLGAGDLLGGIGALIQVAWDTTTISSSYTMNTFGLFCQMNLFFNSLSGFGNFYSYLLLTVDRLIYIEFPMRYISLLTHKRAIRAVLIIWAMNIIQTSSMIKWDSGALPEQACAMLNGDIIHRAALYFTLFEVYITTCFVLAPIYGKISYSAWKLIKTEPHISNFPPEGQAEQRKKMQERKLTTTIAVTFGLYVVVYLPLPIYYGIVSQIYSLPFPLHILLGHKIVLLVNRLQNVLNPAIYGCKNRIMKMAYKKMFCRHNAIGAFPLHEI